MLNRERLVERFIKYTKFDTKAKYDMPHTPSTPGQTELAKEVVRDLEKAGVRDIEMTNESVIYCTIPDNLSDNHPKKDKVPVLGFLTHLDTATDANGHDVKARVIPNYQGEVITYQANPEIKLDPQESHLLKECIGHTIITSDGTTLLGGDDKAGVSIMVELAHYLSDHPEMKHGKIRLAVIPDEEIGVGTEKLDLKKFGVSVAYTLDGGETGEIDVESFNGFMGKLEVEGYIAFPGYGKGTYLNSIQVFAEFVANMKDRFWPQNADGRKSIWWLDEVSGGVGKTASKIFLRSFDIKDMDKFKAILEEIKQKVLKKFPKAKINVNVDKTYLNYKFELEKEPRVVRYAVEAMKKAGVKPKKNYVRGGNDSCHLCFMGLPSTNIFIGMQHMHSVREWITVEAMEASLRTAASIANVWFKHTK